MATKADSSWMTERFNSSNADVKFRSSDGVEFDLHRALLQAHSDAFPGPEIDTHGEVVQLTEPATVLQVLFDFIYPKRHSDLEDKDFEFVAALAEAVEKYEVFSAMPLCNVRLRSFLPRHAEDVLIHAVKHNYPKLINEAIPHLARSSFVSILERLPPCYLLPWARYHEAWVTVFKEARQQINQFPITTGASPTPSHKRSSSLQCHQLMATSPSRRGICSVCHTSVSRWVTQLEEIDTEEALTDALGTPNSNEDCCCPNELWGVAETSCQHMKDLSEFFRNQIKAIPPFADFVGGKK